MADCPFKIGDRVRAIDDYGAVLTGLTGTVRKFNSHAKEYLGIEFDSDFFLEGGGQVGHNLGGTLPDGCRRGWNVPFIKLELLTEEIPLEIDLDSMFIDLPRGSNEPPELSRISISKCLIASATYNYASLDEDGQLWFYKEPPKNTAYFMTAEVKFM